MSEEITNAIVIDTGSGYVKADFAGEENPRFVFPTVVGKPPNFNQSNNPNSMLIENTPNNQQPIYDKEFYIGDEAINKRGILQLSRPLSKGFVTNWDD